MMIFYSKPSAEIERYQVKREKTFLKNSLKILPTHAMAKKTLLFLSDFLKN